MIKIGKNGIESWNSDGNEKVLVICTRNIAETET